MNLLTSSKDNLFFKSARSQSARLTKNCVVTVGDENHKISDKKTEFLLDTR
jgi:hypothetical protein